MHTAAVLFLIVEVGLVVTATQPPYGTLEKTTELSASDILTTESTASGCKYMSPCPMQFTTCLCDCQLEANGWTINCSDSDMRQMPVITSQDHPIKRLILSSNKISFISAVHFENLRALEVLQVNNNEIECLRQEVLDTLPSITIFDWHDNPISCDCDLSWLSSWKADHQGVYVNSPAAGCSNTEEMTGSTSDITRTACTASTVDTEGTVSDAGSITTEKIVGSTSDYILKLTTSQASPRPASIHLEYIIPPIAAAVIIIVVVAAVVVFMVRRKRAQPSERYVEAPLHNRIERINTQKSANEYESIGSVLAGDYLEPRITANISDAPQMDHHYAVIGDTMTADQSNTSAGAYVNILPLARYQGQRLPTVPLPRSMEQHLAATVKQDIETEPLYETLRGEDTHNYSSPVSSAGAQQHSRGGAVNAGYLEP